MKLFFKTVKLRSDINDAIKSFPGISNTEILYRWCIDTCNKLVDYATYTTFTQVDDFIAIQLRVVITDNWSIIEKTINSLLKGQEIDAEVTKNVCDEIIANTEVANPLPIISIISLLLNIIALIRDAKKNKTETETDTDSGGNDTQRRPVLNALKRMLRKNKEREYGS
ncbi:MAG: hypothetical protein LBG58_12115 [Planctomycetaceae bacterium]|nr:hypothetical protein [Planctomycetaceae bacterium]